ncbi:hypothetical protein BY996DRAFT_6502834 [Phakopsora pachyrhizi]|nr:hypothetical protein BY996DRAFT_6502834 [Phakopsora pachyrhizi]
MVVVDLDDAEVKLEMISEVSLRYGCGNGRDRSTRLDVLCCDLSGIVVVEEDGNGEEGNNEQFGDEGASKRDFCGCDIKDTFENVEGRDDWEMGPIRLIGLV